MAAVELANWAGTNGMSSLPLGTLSALTSFRCQSLQVKGGTHPRFNFDIYAYCVHVHSTTARDMGRRARIASCCLAMWCASSLFARP